MCAFINRCLAHGADYVKQASLLNCLAAPM